MLNKRQLKTQLATTAFVLTLYLHQIINPGSVSSEDEIPFKKLNGSEIKCDQNGTCTCPLDPITDKYIDPLDPSCQWFYLCHMGNAFRRRCHVRQAFHIEKHTCLPRSMVSYTDCRPPVNCEKDGYMEDPYDCRKYYLCFYLQAYHYGCKSKHFYEADKQRCTMNVTQTEACKPKLLKPTASTTIRPPNSLNLSPEALDKLLNSLASNNALPASTKINK